MFHEEETRRTTQMGGRVEGEGESKRNDIAAKGNPDGWLWAARNNHRAFPFTAVYFCATIRESGEICQDTLNIENQEPGQCVLLRLVSGVQWVRAKKQQGIPELSKVMMEAEEWRSEEIKQPNIFNRVVHSSW